MRRSPDSFGAPVGDPLLDTPRLIATLVAAGLPLLSVEPVRRGLRERYLELLGA